MNWDHTRLFPNAESEIVSLDAGSRWDGLPVLQFWVCVLETLSSKLARRILERRKCERVIQSHSHLDDCIFESIDNAAVIQMINQGRSPSLRHVTRSHRVDWDWLFERVNLDCSILMKIRANKRSVDKGNVYHDAKKHFLLTLCQLRRLHESHDVRSFFHKSISCSVLAKTQAMSQVMKQAENVHQVWRLLEKSLEVKLRSG